MPARPNNITVRGLVLKEKANDLAKKLCMYNFKALNR